MNELNRLSVDELNKLHTHLQAAASILNSDGLTLTELYANDKEDALKLECMAIYVMGELSKRMKNKTN
jgi:hypothetical protein